MTTVAQSVQDVGGNRCQADGCMADLSGLRRYFRRYHVCEIHIRSQVVLIGGREVRFCDQCSTFHPLNFFDGSRRTCREKLEQNRLKRRLRKGQPGGGGGNGVGQNVAAAAAQAAAAAGGGGGQQSDDANSDDQPPNGSMPDADEAALPSPTLRASSSTAGRRGKRPSGTAGQGARRQQPMPRQSAGADVTRALGGYRASTSAGQTDRGESQSPDPDDEEADPRTVVGGADGCFREASAWGVEAVAPDMETGPGFHGGAAVKVEDKYAGLSAARRIGPAAACPDDLGGAMPDLPRPTNHYYCHSHQHDLRDQEQLKAALAGAQNDPARYSPCNAAQLQPLGPQGPQAQWLPHPSKAQQPYHGQNQQLQQQNLASSAWEAELGGVPALEELRFQGAMQGRGQDSVPRRPQSSSMPNIPQERPASPTLWATAVEPRSTWHGVPAIPGLASDGVPDGPQARHGGLGLPAGNGGHADLLEQHQHQPPQAPNGTGGGPSAAAVLNGRDGALPQLGQDPLGGRMQGRLGPEQAEDGGAPAMAPLKRFMPDLQRQSSRPVQPSPATEPLSPVKPAHIGGLLQASAALDYPLGPAQKVAMQLQRDAGLLSAAPNGFAAPLGGGGRHGTAAHNTSFWGTARQLEQDVLQKGNGNALHPSFMPQHHQQHQGYGGAAGKGVHEAMAWTDHSSTPQVVGAAWAPRSAALLGGALGGGHALRAALGSAVLAAGPRPFASMPLMPNSAAAGGAMDCDRHSAGSSIYTADEEAGFGVAGPGMEEPEVNTAALVERARAAAEGRALMAPPAAATAASGAAGANANLEACPSLLQKASFQLDLETAMIDAQRWEQQQQYGPGVLQRWGQQPVQLVLNIRHPAMQPLPQHMQQQQPGPPPPLRLYPDKPRITLLDHIQQHGLVAPQQQQRLQEHGPMNSIGGGSLLDRQQQQQQLEQQQQPQQPRLLQQQQQQLQQQQQQPLVDMFSRFHQQRQRQAALTESHPQFSRFQATGDCDCDLNFGYSLRGAAGAAGAEHWQQPYAQNGEALAAGRRVAGNLINQPPIIAATDRRSHLGAPGGALAPAPSHPAVQLTTTAWTGDRGPGPAVTDWRTVNVDTVAAPGVGAGLRHPPPSLLPAGHAPQHYLPPQQSQLQQQAPGNSNFAGGGPGSLDPKDQELILSALQVMKGAQQRGPTGASPFPPPATDGKDHGSGATFVLPGRGAAVTPEAAAWGSDRGVEGIGPDRRRVAPPPPLQQQQHQGAVGDFAARDPFGGRAPGLAEGQHQMSVEGGSQELARLMQPELSMQISEVLLSSGRSLMEGEGVELFEQVMLQQQDMRAGAAVAPAASGPGAGPEAGVGCQGGPPTPPPHAGAGGFVGESRPTSEEERLLRAASDTEMLREPWPHQLQQARNGGGVYASTGGEHCEAQLGGGGVLRAWTSSHQQQHQQQHQQHQQQHQHQRQRQQQQFIQERQAQLGYPQHYHHEPHQQLQSQWDQQLRQQQVDLGGGGALPHSLYGLLYDADGRQRYLGGPGPGVAGGGSSGGVSNLALKLSHARAEALPGDLLERMQDAMGRGGGGSAALPPTTREGCVEVLVEVMHGGGCCSAWELSRRLFCLPATAAAVLDVGAGSVAAKAEDTAAEKEAAMAAGEQLREWVGGELFDSCERVTMQLRGGLVLDCRPGSPPVLRPWEAALQRAGLPFAARWPDLLLLVSGPPVLVADVDTPQHVHVLAPAEIESRLDLVQLCVRMAGAACALGAVQAVAVASPPDETDMPAPAEVAATDDQAGHGACPATDAAASLLAATFPAGGPLPLVPHELTSDEDPEAPLLHMCNAAPFAPRGMSDSSAFRAGCAATAGADGILSRTEPSQQQQQPLHPEKQPTNPRASAAQEDATTDSMRAGLPSASWEAHLGCGTGGVSGLRAFRCFAVEERKEEESTDAHAIKALPSAAAAAAAAAAAGTGGSFSGFDSAVPGSPELPLRSCFSLAASCLSHPSSPVGTHNQQRRRGSPQSKDVECSHQQPPTPDHLALRLAHHPAVRSRSRSEDGSALRRAFCGLHIGSGSSSDEASPLAPWPLTCMSLNRQVSSWRGAARQGEAAAATATAVALAALRIRRHNGGLGLDALTRRTSACGSSAPTASLLLHDRLSYRSSFATGITTATTLHDRMSLRSAWSCASTLTSSLAGPPSGGGDRGRGGSCGGSEQLPLSSSGGSSSGGATASDSSACTTPGAAADGSSRSSGVRCRPGNAARGRLLPTVPTSPLQLRSGEGVCEASDGAAQQRQQQHPAVRRALSLTCGQPSLKLVRDGDPTDTDLAVETPRLVLVPAGFRSPPQAVATAPGPLPLPQSSQRESGPEAQTGFTAVSAPAGLRPLQLHLPVLPRPGLALLEATGGHLVAGCWPLLVVETAAQRDELAALWRELASEAGRQGAWRSLAEDLGLLLGLMPRRNQGRDRDLADVGQLQRAPGGSSTDLGGSGGGAATPGGIRTQLDGCEVAERGGGVGDADGDGGGWGDVAPASTLPMRVRALAVAAAAASLAQKRACLDPSYCDSLPSGDSMSPESWGTLLLHSSASEQLTAPPSLTSPSPTPTVVTAAAALTPDGSGHCGSSYSLRSALRGCSGGGASVASVARDLEGLLSAAATQTAVHAVATADEGGGDASGLSSCGVGALDSKGEEAGDDPRVVVDFLAAVRVAAADISAAAAARGGDGCCGAPNNARRERLGVREHDATAGSHISSNGSREGAAGCVGAAVSPLAAVEEALPAVPRTFWLGRGVAKAVQGPDTVGRQPPPVAAVGLSAEARTALRAAAARLRGLVDARRLPALRELLSRVEVGEER